MSSMGFLHSGTQAKGFVIFTSSQNWTVPTGVYKIKVLAIGGGGGGGGGYSSTYVGGGGASGGIVFAEVLVAPDTELNIIIGGGGSPGTGGASPTAGGGGGNTIINISNGALMAVFYGNGGGAATSSANGSAGGPPSNTQYLMQSIQGPTPALITKAYGLLGNSGSGQLAGLTPVFAPDLSTAASGVQYGAEQLGNTTYETFGDGGPGGNVNANGEPGIQGVVVIWWGDD